MSEGLTPKLKPYVGYIWIGDQPGIRINVMAKDPVEAHAAVEAQYGTGHVPSIWNEDDAKRAR